MDNSWIKIHRKIQGSDIWKKPSDWLKIWMYILQEVNFGYYKHFDKGENFFNYHDVARQCGVSYNSVVKCVKWLKLATQVATRKTTRGVIIKVLNYAKYQDNENRESKTCGNTGGNTVATQKQHRSYTIKEEDKERKEKKEVVVVNTVGEFYENNFGLLTPYSCEELVFLGDHHGEDNLLKALKIAIESGKRNIGYVKGILNNEEQNDYKWEKLKKAPAEDIFYKGLAVGQKRQLDLMIKQYEDNLGEYPKPESIKIMIKKITNGEIK